MRSLARQPSGTEVSCRQKKKKDLNRANNNKAKRGMGETAIITMSLMFSFFFSFRLQFFSFYAGVRPNFSRYCVNFSSFTRTNSSSFTIFSDRIDTVSRSSWMV